MTSFNTDTRTLSNSLVGANGETLVLLNRRRKLPWAYGMSVVAPELVPASKDHDSRWQCVTRTLAVADPDTKIRCAESDMYKEIRPVSHNRHQEWCTLRGEATPQKILDLLSTSFRYPAALLYADTDLYELYSAFKGTGSRSTARLRTYGKIKQLEEIELDNKQCVRWRSAFETADLDQQAGDKERRLRFINTDNRVLRFA